jgi:hypothetical protein
MKDTVLSRRELFWLAAGVIASLAVHAIFAIKGFGESDAARLAFQAAVWAKTGELPAIGYTVRTSPLYIHSLKMAVQAGLSIAALPGLMCYMSLVLGSLAFVPMYLLWRKLAGVKAAALGLVVYSFMPAFWLGNIYGMPHLPAFFFFLCGLWCFSVAVGKATHGAGLPLFASALFAAVGIGLKADIILCYGAFLWFALWTRPVSLRNVAAACLISVIGVLAAMCHTKLIARKYVSASEWSGSFPFTFSAITNIENVAVLVVSAGIGLFIVTLACILYCAVRRRYLNILLLAVVWAAPVVLFWGLKPGNIARHMMAGCAPLALVVAVVMACEIRNWKLLLTAVIVILAANYFISPSFSLPRSGRPSSRLFESQSHIQARVDSWHDAGKAFALLPDEQKILCGQDYIIYAMWEMIARAKSFSHTGKSEWVFAEDGRRQKVKFIYSPVNQPLPEAEPGWNMYLWSDNGQRSRIERQ